MLRSHRRPHTWIWLAIAGLTAAACSGGGASSSGTGAPAPAGAVRAGGTLVFALAEDPDKLDPTLARTLVGREVFANMCEKLYDVNSGLNVIPQLASALPQLSNGGKTVTITLRQGVKFNDGTPFDAQAVKTSLDRHRTLPGSARAAELKSVTSVQVVDPYTVRLELSKPFSPLAATLADRAGMIMSPTQLAKLGTNFTSDPVCVGPFSFVSRTPGNQIVLAKSKYYYDAAKVKLDKVIFKIITDPNVRLANLRSGDVNAAERLAPTEISQVQNSSSLQLVTATSIGYQGITINVGNASGVGKPVGQVNSPLAKSPQLREAFALSLDRNTINKVVFAGKYAPDCSPIPLNSPYRDSTPCPPADVAKAKQLVAQSGVPTPVPVNLIIGTDPESARFGQVIQSMAQQAGFKVTLQPTEFTTSLDQTDAGKFQAFAIGWSGRVDPDGNTYNFMATGAPLNIAGLSDPIIDQALNQARTTTDVQQRKSLYAKALAEQAKQNGLIYLYRQKLFLGVSKKVGGISYYGDGLPRLATAGFVG